MRWLPVRCALASPALTLGFQNFDTAACGLTADFTTRWAAIAPAPKQKETR